MTPKYAQLNHLFGKTEYPLGQPFGKTEQLKNHHPSGWIKKLKR